MFGRYAPLVGKRRLAVLSSIVLKRLCGGYVGLGTKL